MSGAITSRLLFVVLTRYARACWFIAMEIGVSSIPVSEVRCPVAQMDSAVHTCSHLVLLRGTHFYRGELCSLRLLQGHRYPEARGRAAAEVKTVPCMTYRWNLLGTEAEKMYNVIR